MTSESKGKFGVRTFTLLDRPNELTGRSVLISRSINISSRSLNSDRSNTLAAEHRMHLEKHPIDGIAGFKDPRTRCVGFGFAYRYNFNQQDRDAFNDELPYTNTVAIPCRAGQTTGCPQTVSSSFRGVPLGFQASSDPHGLHRSSHGLAAATSVLKQLLTRLLM